MKVLIDNGHGENMPGKCSSDGRWREWDIHKGDCRYKKGNPLCSSQVERIAYKKTTV